MNSMEMKVIQAPNFQQLRPGSPNNFRNDYTQSPSSPKSPHSPSSPNYSPYKQYLNSLAFSNDQITKDYPKVNNRYNLGESRKDTIISPVRKNYESSVLKSSDLPSVFLNPNIKNCSEYKENYINFGGNYVKNIKENRIKFPVDDYDYGNASERMKRFFDRENLDDVPQRKMHKFNNKSFKGLRDNERDYSYNLFNLDIESKTIIKLNNYLF